MLTRMWSFTLEKKIALIEVYTMFMYKQQIKW